MGLVTFILKLRPLLPTTKQQKDKVVEIKTGLKEK